MSIARTIGKGVAWTSFGTIADKILMLFNMFLILSYLSVYDYGISKLVFSVLSMMSIILLPGLSSAIIADIGVERGANNHSRAKTIFIQYSLLVSLLSVVAFAVLFFGAHTAAAWSGNPSIEYFLKIVSFSLLISPLRSISLLIATVEVRFIDQAAYSIVEEAAKAVLLLILFYWLHYGPAGLLLAVVISQLVTVIIFIPRTLSGYRLFSHGVGTGSHRFWELFGQHRKWSVVASGLGTIGQNLQLWIIRFMLGTVAVGLYAFASGMVSNVSSLLPFNNVITSLASRYAEKKKELIRIIRMSIKVQFVLGTCLLAVAYLCLPVLLWVFPKYQPARELILVMLVMLIPLSVSGVITPVFAALKEQFAFVISSFWKTLFTLVANLIFIPLLGFVGIGVAAIATHIGTTVERYFRLKRKLPGLSLAGITNIDKKERTFLQSLPSRIFSRKSYALLFEETVVQDKSGTVSK